MTPFLLSRKRNLLRRALCRALLGLIVLLGLLCRPSALLAQQVGGASAAESDSIPLLVRKQIEQLVKDLGHAYFPRREEAMSRLEKLGLLAVPALEAARRHEQLEIRHRVLRLLALTEVQSAQAHLEAFQKDADGRQNTTLPGFQAFRKIAGDGAQARAFFAKMYAAERQLLHAYERDPSAAVELMRNRYGFYRTTGIPELLPLESIAAMLLVALEERAKFSKDAAMYLLGHVTQDHVRFEFRKLASSEKPAGPGSAACKIFQKWLSTPIYDERLLAVLEMHCHRAPYDDGKQELLNFVAKILADPAFREKNAPEHVCMRVAAMSALQCAVPAWKAPAPGTMNRYVELLDSYLDDSAKGPYGVQVRDVAILTLNRFVPFPGGWKFKSFRSLDQPKILSFEAASYTSDEVRQAAIHKWRAKRKAG